MTHQAYKRSSKTTGEAGCHAPGLIKNLGVYSTYFKIQGEARWGRVWEASENSEGFQQLLRQPEATSPSPLPSP